MRTPPAPRHPRYTRSVIRGTLDRLHLGDLLQWLQMGDLSGRLALHDGSRERRLDLLEGRVVYVSSLDPEERLATWLATDGVVSAAAARRLLGASLLRRQLFTDLVVASGEASPATLRASLIRLAERIAGRALAAGELRFEFDPSYPVRDLLGLTIDLAPSTLLMEAARRRDEAGDGDGWVPSEPLPFDGAEFESFFWELIRRGISGEDRLDGSELERLHRLVRDIMATLAQWLASSPGLVPIPTEQASAVANCLGDGRAVRLSGLPHSAWNAMVLACAVRHPELPPPVTLYGLEELGSELDLWVEMTGSELWRRPHAQRLDELTRGVVGSWSRAARAAAGPLGVVPGEAELAVHLLAIPTDLVLWVLTTLPMPHQRLRHALLGDLARRVGVALARRADFPPGLQHVLDLGSPGRLGVCLDIGREILPSAPVWLRTVPEDEASALALASADELAEAAAAAQREFTAAG